MNYEIQYYCIGNIVHDRKFTFNNKEYMINLHINWNIICFNHLEKPQSKLLQRSRRGEGDKSKS